jgi:hypothetical protein
MPFFKVLAVLAVSSLTAAGSACAGASTAAGPKGQKAPIVRSAPPASQSASEAPIVMGRSVGIVRKSKLHHIKAKPAHSNVPSKN